MSRKCSFFEQKYLYWYVRILTGTDPTSTRLPDWATILDWFDCTNGGTSPVDGYTYPRRSATGFRSCEDFRAAVYNCLKNSSDPQTCINRL